MRMLSGSVLQNALLHGQLPSDEVIAATVDLLCAAWTSGARADSPVRRRRQLIRGRASAGGLTPAGVSENVPATPGGLTNRSGVSDASTKAGHGQPGGRRPVPGGRRAAATAIPAAAATADATVTVVHGIPATPVDVYANGSKILSDFMFKSVAGPLQLPPGSYTLDVRKAGSAATSTPVLAATEQLTAGENATVVAALTASGSPALLAFANDTSAVGAGDGRLVVRHVAAAPAVDVYAGATKAVTGLTSGKQAALTVPAGTVVGQGDAGRTDRRRDRPGQRSGDRGHGHRGLRDRVGLGQDADRGHPDLRPRRDAVRSAGGQRGARG